MADDLTTLQMLRRCWTEIATTQDQLTLTNLLVVVHDLEARIARLTPPADTRGMAAER
jgi:hypothetical protein